MCTFKRSTLAHAPKTYPSFTWYAQNLSIYWVWTEKKITHLPNIDLIPLELIKVLFRKANICVLKKIAIRTKINIWKKSSLDWPLSSLSILQQKSKSVFYGEYQNMIDIFCGLFFSYFTQTLSSIIYCEMYTLESKWIT